MLKPAIVFTDHAVLQQGMPVPVFGWTDAETVTVSFAGHTVSSAAEDGRFLCSLPPMKAFEQGEMVIRTENESVCLQDILVGEVWLAGGQSNMEHPVFCSEYREEDLEENENIRLFTVAHRPFPDADIWGWHFEGVRSLDSPWERATKQSILHFSAVGYFFARLLQKNLHVPVGVISCNWAGTTAEAWISEEHLKKNELARREWDSWEKKLSELNLEEYEAYYRENQRQGLAYIKEIGDPVEWVRKNGKEDFMYHVMFPFGWEIGPYHCCKPAGLRETMLERVVPYGIRGVIWFQGCSNTRPEEDNEDWYTAVMHALEEDWREAFRQKELPFYTVQISTFEWDGKSLADDWCRIRDSQDRLCREDAHTYRVISVDVGEKTNIHPFKKQPIGERLALAALSEEYGIFQHWKSPVIQSAKRNGNTVELTFENVGHFRTMDREEPGQFFAFSGKQPTEIRAKPEGGRIILSLPEGKNFDAVGYAYCNYCRANVMNEYGMPLAPFKISLT